MPTKRHSEVKLFVDDLQCLGHARLTHRTQAVQKRATNVGALGPQRDGFDHILPAANATIHVDFNLLTHRFHNRGQCADRRLRAVQLPPTVIGDDQRIRPAVDGQFCIFHILKGIQDVEDAKLAVNSGADALIVSNHGGRQLDGAQSSIGALPAIVEAVGQQIEVHMDGGIRSGQDVIKAIALGAKGTYIGRSFLYGLGAMGEAGVTKALQIIHKELDLTMAFCGHTNIRTVDKGILLPGTF